MVAADHHDHGGRQSLRQCRYKPVKQRSRLRGRNGLVINIAGDDNRVRLPVCGNLHDFPENIRLILSHVPVHQFQTDMKIR